MLKESIQKLMSYLREVQIGMVYGSVNLSRRGISSFPVEVFIGMDLTTQAVSQIPVILTRIRRLSQGAT